MILAEADLSVLGVLDRTPATPDARLRRADDLTGFDVLMGDGQEDAAATAGRAAEAGISCVLWTEDDIEWQGDRTLVVGANLGSGIAPALASHQAAMAADGEPLTIAWTEPGRPLRSGVAVPFPDPVGSLWAEDRSNGDARRLAAPVAGGWAGALVMVGDPRRPSRVVGVADDARHLEAMALAAATVTVARGRYPTGVVTVEAAAEDFLLAAIAMGLEVAGLAGR